MSKKKLKLPWSSYWMGDALTRYRDSTSETEKLMRLSHIRRGIANFVNILTGKDIAVKFSSGQMSYTDGQKFVVISALNEPDQFDAQVGRALHEATHIVRSQRVFAFLRSLDRYPTKYIDDVLIRSGALVKRDALQIQKDLALMVNFLEDRRNDLWGFKQAPGYRPYYESHYAQCFYSKVIDEALHHPLFRIPVMKAWELHILNLFNRHADPDALPGLRKVWEIVDLPHIDRYDNDPLWAPWEQAAEVDPIRGTCMLPGMTAFSSYPDSILPTMIVDAKEILNIIYQNSIYLQIIPKDKGKPANDGEGAPKDKDMNDFGEGGESDERFSDLGNYDMADQDEDSTGTEEGDSVKGTGDIENKDEGIDTGKAEKKMTPEEAEKFKEKVKKALRRQRMEVMGETEKANLTSDQAEILNHLESSDAEMREVYDAELGDAKCKVVVYKHVTEDTLKIPDLGFSSVYNGVLQPCASTVQAIANGKILGNLLAHRIRVMNDEGMVRVTRQKQGRFDKRLAASIATDNDNLFFKTHTAQIEPVMVDLSIDASGSMQGVKWEKAMTLSIALAVAAAKIRSFRIRINVRASWGEIANVGVVYDSKKDNVKKIDTLFKYLWPMGGTPEGLCYDAMGKELLEEIKQIRRFFVNLSDGEPCFSFGDRSTSEHVNYYGTPACKHTKRQVDKLRNLGVKILSFFICDGYYGDNASRRNAVYHDDFHMMYGKDARYISPTDVTEVAFVLNKLFLKE